MVEDVLAVVADEEIVEAVVVIIADAHGLSPAGVGEAGLERHIGEGAIAIIFEEVTDRLLSFGETFQAPPIDQKDIEPAIVVVIVEGDAASRGFEEILIFFYAAKDGLGVEACLPGHVGEADSERAAGRRSTRCRIFCKGRRGRRAGEGQHIGER